MDKSSLLSVVHSVSILGASVLILVAVATLTSNGPHTAAAALPSYSFYISPNGSDANDCSKARPCATMQFAVDKIPNGSIGSINLADGTYKQTANVIYHRVVAFFGNCDTFGKVAIEVPDGQVGITGQDHAIVTIQCIDFKSAGAAAGAIKLRQFTIGDINFVRFWDFPSGFHMAISEMSKMNCLNNDYIQGGATVHAALDGASTVNLNCTIIAQAVPIDNFIVADDHSVAMISGAKVVDYGVKGRKYIVNALSSLTAGGNLIPGSIPGMADASSLVR